MSKGLERTHMKPRLKEQRAGISEKPHASASPYLVGYNRITQSHRHGRFFLILKIEKKNVPSLRSRRRWRTPKYISSAAHLQEKHTAGNVLSLSERALCTAAAAAAGLSMGVSCAAAVAARAAAPMMQRVVRASSARAPTPQRHQSWSPSQSQTMRASPRAPQRRAPTPRRQCVVVKSSKASKSGRFPPTPCTDNHPLQSTPPATATAPQARRLDDAGGGGGGGGGEHAVAGGGGDAVGRLCAEWRAAAGKPGATVMREVQAMLNPSTSDDDNAPTTSSTDATAPTSMRTDDDADAEWRLLLTHRNENLYNAYALEVAALSPGSASLATGLFAAPRPLQPAVLARMVGLRAVVDPLCVGATAEELVEAARALPVRLPDIAIHNAGVYVGDDDGDSDALTPPTAVTHATPVALHHDCVVRNPTRVPSEDLSRALGEVVGGWGGGFTHGMYARFKNPADPDSIAGLRDTLRFVVIETAAGYILGLVTFAPPQPPPSCDWNRKPNNFCAGTRIEIAAVAINALVGAGAGAIKSAGWKGEVGGSSPAASKSDEKKTKKARAVIVAGLCRSNQVDP
jgi:hypothetical protein